MHQWPRSLIGKGTCLRNKIVQVRILPGLPAFYKRRIGGEQRNRTPILSEPSQVSGLVAAHAAGTLRIEIWSEWQELNLREHVPKTCGWPLPYTRTGGHGENRTLNSGVQNQCVPVSTTRPNLGPVEIVETPRCRLQGDCSSA